MDFRIRVNKLFEFFYQRRWIAPRQLSMIAHPSAPKETIGGGVSPRVEPSSGGVSFARGSAAVAAAGWGGTTGEGGSVASAAEGVPLNHPSLAVEKGRDQRRGVEKPGDLVTGISRLS
jgi:hypothetical protein